MKNVQKCLFASYGSNLKMKQGMIYCLFSEDTDDQEAYCLWGYVLAAGAPLSSHVQPINQYQI